MRKKISWVISFLWVQIEKGKFLAKFCQSVSRKGIKTMGRRYFIGLDGAVVLWDELCRQSVHGWLEGRGDQLLFGWLCSSRCDFQWPYQRGSLCSRETMCSQAKRGSSSSSPLPIRGQVGAIFFTPIQRLLFNITSVLLRSGWLHLTLAQRLCLRPASLGRPFMCCCCVSVVQQRLQRTISVVAGCTGLAAAVGVVVWNWRRSFGCGMGGTVGLNWLRFDLISWGQLSTVHWVAWIMTCNTCQRTVRSEWLETI